MDSQPTVTRPLHKSSDFVSDVVPKKVPTKKSLADIASVHSAEFLKRSDELDRSAGFPTQNFAEMRESGLLKMALPNEFGGSDASMLDVGQILHELSKGCPSTALIFNMHLAFSGQLAHMWRLEPEGQWGKWLSAISENNMLLGGALSESSSWNAALYPQAKATPVAGGYRVNGSRSFCTGSNYLDLMQCTAHIEQSDGSRRCIYFIISPKAEGIEWKGDWDTLGMRGSASQGFHLNNVFVPNDAIAYEYGYGVMDLSQTWLSFLAWSFIGFASVYSGIAEHASNYAIDVVSKRSRAPGTHPLSHKPSTQRHAAQAIVSIATMKSIREDIARRYANRAQIGLEAIIDTSIAKQVCVTKAIEAVGHAVSLVGGQAYYRKLRLERLIRDVRAGPFHPFSTDDSLEMLGKLTFGLSFMEPPGWAM